MDLPPLQNERLKYQIHIAYAICIKSFFSIVENMKIQRGISNEVHEQKKKKLYNVKSLYFILKYNLLLRVYKKCFLDHFLR